MPILYQKYNNFGNSRSSRYIVSEHTICVLYVLLMSATIAMKFTNYASQIAIISIFIYFFPTTTSFFLLQEYAFLEETLPDRMTKSTLIVRRSEAKHFGAYNCTVINSFGVDSVEITLLPDSKYRFMQTLNFIHINYKDHFD